MRPQSVFHSSVTRWCWWCAGSILVQVSFLSSVRVAQQHHWARIFERRQPYTPRTRWRDLISTRHSIKCPFVSYSLQTLDLVFLFNAPKFSFSWSCRCWVRSMLDFYLKVAVMVVPRWGKNAVVAMNTWVKMMVKHEMPPLKLDLSL